MAKEKVTKSILFADISKSTALYEQLGDSKAQKVIAAGIKLLIKAIVRHEGIVVKTIGDEVMSVFDDPSSAMEAAILMQKLMEQLSAKLYHELNRPLNIQIGTHWGTVIHDNTDYFGDAVNVAARVVGLAKERQILATRQATMSLPKNLTEKLRKIGTTNVKGKKQQLEIFEMIWERENVTIMVDTLPEDLPPPDTHCLELTFKGRTLILNENHPSVTAGRHSTNDIIVNDDLISRLHARIELRRGQFILADQSVNGTYLLAKGSKQNYLRQTEYALNDSGFISLGRIVDPQGRNTITFKNLSSDQKNGDQRKLSMSKKFKKFFSFIKFSR